MTDNMVKCFAINHFGKGQHPMATEVTVGQFVPKYVRECLTRMAGSDKMSAEGKAAANKLLNA